MENRKSYNIIFVIYVLLFIYMVIAFFVSQGTGSSLFFILFRWSPSTSLVSTESMKSVAETIGFSSLLIAWIYASLDKEEYGILYSDLIKSISPLYHWLVLSHLISTLLCLWFSSSDFREVSFMAILVMICGCYFQWQVLSNVIMKTRKRKELAISVWNRRIEKYGCSIGENPKLLSMIIGMAKVIPLNEGMFSLKICKLFAYALTRYTNCFYKASSDKRCEILIDMVNVWSALFENRSIDEQDVLLKYIFTEYANFIPLDDSWDVSCCLSCCTLIFLLYKNGEAFNEEPLAPDVILQNIKYRLTYLDECLNYSQVRNHRLPLYLKGGYLFLRWNLLLRGISASIDNIEFDFLYLNHDKYCSVFDTFSTCLFTDDQEEQKGYSKIIWDMLT